MGGRGVRGGRKRRKGEPSEPTVAFRGDGELMKGMMRGGGASGEEVSAMGLIRRRREATNVWRDVSERLRGETSSLSQQQPAAPNAAVMSMSVYFGRRAERRLSTLQHYDDACERLSPSRRRLVTCLLWPFFPSRRLRRRASICSKGGNAKLCEQAKAMPWRAVGAYLPAANCWLLGVTAVTCLVVD